MALASIRIALKWLGSPQQVKCLASCLDDRGYWGGRRNLSSSVGVMPTLPCAHNSPRVAQQARHGAQLSTADANAAASTTLAPRRRRLKVVELFVRPFERGSLHTCAPPACPQATGMCRRATSQRQNAGSFSLLSARPLNRAGEAAPPIAAPDVIEHARGLMLELEASACEPRASWAAPGASAGSRNLLWRRSCSSSTGLPTLSSRSPALRCFTP